MNSSAARNLLTEAATPLRDTVPPYKQQDAQALQEEMTQHHEEAERLKGLPGHELAVACHKKCKSKIAEVLGIYRRERRKRIFGLCYECYPLPQKIMQEWSPEEQEYARDIQARVRKPQAKWAPANNSSTRVTIVKDDIQGVNTGNGRSMLGQGATLTLPDLVAGALVAKGMARPSVWTD